MDFALDVSNRVFYMDEGLIYEDGPPGQIFESPRREKTRVFINRVRSFNYHTDSPDFDLYEMNAEIEHFCEKHVFPRPLVHDILLIVEELLILHQSQSDKIDVDLRIAYSEKHGTVEIIFEYTGGEGNLLEKAGSDDLGAIIIRNKAEKIDYQRVNARNKLSMHVKKG